MNALNIANDLFSLTTTNKNMLLIAVVAFGMLCVYKMVTGPDWFAKVLGVVLLVVAVGMLAGCSNGPTDPLGATSRTRLRTDASVSIAQADANARIAQAQAEQAARISEANALIITEQSKQNGAMARTMAWATTLPIILLIVGAAVVVALVVNWQGRIWLERTRQAPQLAQQAQQWPQLNADQLRLLQNYARRSGQRLIRQEDGYYLDDGQRTVKALLKG